MWNCAVEGWVRKIVLEAIIRVLITVIAWPGRVSTRWRASAMQASTPAACFSHSAFSSPRGFILSKGYTCLAAGSLFSAALLGQSNAGKERNYCNFHSRAKSWYYYCNLGRQFSWGPKHFRHWTIAAIASSWPLLSLFFFAGFISADG